MGYTAYSVENRTLRSENLGYTTADVADIFTQQRKRRIHDSMSPNGVDKRECRDSDAHPNTVPIILALDETGSMGHIPHELIKEGLPTLMSSLIQNGVPDASILFLGIGDHVCDEHPLQVGQFESGDEELDMWLTRTYLEGNGGGNEGESYHLAWYFAANHTVTDAFEKRGKKGFLFTVGDEPCIKNLSKRHISGLMGSTARGQDTTADALLKEASEKYDVYHLNIMEGYRGKDSLSGWKERLGKNCIQVNDHRDVAKIISKIVRENLGDSLASRQESRTEISKEKNPAEDHTAEQIL